MCNTFILNFANCSSQDIQSKKNDGDDQKVAGEQSLFSVAAIARIAALPGVGALLLIKTVCGVPIGILQSMFSVGRCILPGFYCSCLFWDFLLQ